MPDSPSRDSGFKYPLSYHFEVWAFSFPPRCPNSLSCINECHSIDSGGNVIAYSSCVIAALLECFQVQSIWCWCHGLSVPMVWVWNKVRLPATGQSAHVIGGSRVTRPVSNSRRTLLNWDCGPQFNKTQIFDPTSNLQPVILSTCFDYLRTTWNLL